MSEQNGELQTEQNSKEAWQEQEKQDNRLLNTDDLQTECLMIKGKPSLTHVGYCKIVNNSENISVTSLEYHKIESETENGILVVVSGVNKQGDQRWAAHFEPRDKDNPQFDWAKSFSKAQRNLFRMFLYGKKIVDETLEKFEQKHGKKGQRRTNGEQPAKSSAKNATPKGNPLEQAKNATRTTVTAPSTRSILKAEFGVGLDELNAAAVALWGNQDKWDVRAWQTYNNEILELRKKKGYLYDKLGELHEKNAA